MIPLKLSTVMPGIFGFIEGRLQRMFPGSHGKNSQMLEGEHLADARVQPAETGKDAPEPPTTDIHFDPCAGVICNPALKLEARSYGMAPVQADGFIDGFPFYFRARGSYWFFVVSLSAETEPDCWMYADTDGHFTDELGRGYALTGEYGTDFRASYMPFQDVERILTDCAKKFLSDPSALPPRGQ